MLPKIQNYENNILVEIKKIFSLLEQIKYLNIDQISYFYKINFNKGINP